jgi:hypothetical protein
MSDKFDLPGNGWAEIRAELTGGDQKWFFCERDRLVRSNGTARPARSVPDPANTAVMMEIPAVPAELLSEDNFSLLDMLAGRLLISWSRTESLPWTPALREALPLEVVDAVDSEIIKAMRRLQGLGPKPQTSGGTSGSTSRDDAAAPQTGPTPEPSATASGSSGAG